MSVVCVKLWKHVRKLELKRIEKEPLKQETVKKQHATRGRGKRIPGTTKN